MPEDEVSPTPVVPRHKLEPEPHVPKEPIQIVHVMPVQPVVVQPAAPLQPIIEVLPVQPVVQPVAPVPAPPQEAYKREPELPTPTPLPEAEVPKREPIVKAKELTPVREREPEKINEEINKSPSNVNFPVNFSPAPTAKKLPKKMQFKGKKGRQRTEAEVIDLLTFVQARNGVWPSDNYVSEQMRRYYRREYPEYFTKGKGKKGKKVQTARSAPIDISTRWA